MDKDRLATLVEKFGEVPVFVVGDIGLDQYTDGASHRLSPEAPVPVVNPVNRWNKLGLAGNVAENVITLGGEPHLFSVIGDDETGCQITQMCERKGIISYLEKDSTRPTTFKHRIMSGNHHFLRIDDESTDPLHVDHVLNVLHAFEYALIGSPKAVVIIQDYGKGLITPAIYTTIADRCSKHGLKLLVDPNQKKGAVHYPDCFLLTPNVKEAEALSGVLIRDNASLLKAGQTILKQSKAEHCVITRGEKGMAHIQKDILHPLLIPTFAKAVFDVSGAGDTVIATMALAFSVGATPFEACILGNVAAGIVVGKVGTATCSREELLVSLSALSGFLPTQ
jgi:rfaE bifunctional protein kinase chain/domain